MSDGTATLYFLDLQTFQEIGRTVVRDGKQPVMRLNELEWIDGQIYANVWMTDRIAVIDPTTGEVQQWLDLTELYIQALLDGIHLAARLPLPRDNCG